MTRLSVCLFVRLFWYLMDCLSAYLPACCLPTCLSACLSLCLSVCHCGSARPVTVKPATTDASHTVSLFVCLSLSFCWLVVFCLSVFVFLLFGCLSVCLFLRRCEYFVSASTDGSVSLFWCLIAYLSVCLSLRVFHSWYGHVCLLL